MLLYTISAIPVLEMIKDNNQIKGHTTKRNNNIKVQCYADDTTIIINKPREMKAVNEIYKRHSEASEAKVNEDKTQIFRLGEKGNKAAERDAGIHDKVYSKVTILGAKFCKDKQRETAENLKKANGLLEKMKASTEYYYLSIVGKILKINTYIYTTIYNNAWLINTSSKDFQDFIKRVSTYIQRIKSSEVYEKVASERELEG